jgi:hypothetical protein
MWFADENVTMKNGLLSQVLQNGGQKILILLVLRFLISKLVIISLTSCYNLEKELES